MNVKFGEDASEHCRRGELYAWQNLVSVLNELSDAPLSDEPKVERLRRKFDHAKNLWATWLNEVTYEAA